jgi:3-deoxy-manno-octulosonate cytidylyltransferase (CMP-KDO synthetase)
MQVSFKVVIPARHASTRLPGKPLREIAGKTMIEHVWRSASRSGAEQVVIATDDDRIASAAAGFGAEVCITRADHASGTDRLAEVVETLSWPDATIVVNVQGDEPLMPAELVRQVAADLAAQDLARIATAATPIHSAAEYFDPNVVKVVTDHAGYALYFSRAPIPWDRDRLVDGQQALPQPLAPLRHIGLYAYRAGFLSSFARMEPTRLENTEQLEQLRALWSGERIHVLEIQEHPGPGVDTERDIALVEEILRSRAAGRSVPV